MKKIIMLIMLWTVRWFSNRTSKGLKSEQPD